MENLELSLVVGTATIALKGEQTRAELAERFYTGKFQAAGQL